MNLKKLSIVLLLLFCTYNLYAKNYTAALGARFELGKHGNEGVTYKYFLTGNNALEGMVLSDFSNGLEFHGFYEYHNTLPAIPSQIKWFIGLGAHIGTWEKDEFVLGPDGLIGIEYVFDKLPLAIALDWHPVYNIITEKDDRFWPMKFGLTARYIF